MQQSVIDRTSISLIISRPYNLTICEFEYDLPSISSSTLCFNFASTANGKAQTKVKILLSQFNNFATMAWEMVITMKALIKAKMKVDIKEKTLNNLKTIKNLEVLINIKFKTKIIKMLNL
jgi:hypothetical protein